MKLHTARQVLCDVTGIIAGNIAKARGSSPIQVIDEAKITVLSSHKVEQQRKRRADYANRETR